MRGRRGLEEEVEAEVDVGEEADLVMMVGLGVVEGAEKMRGI